MAGLSAGDIVKVTSSISPAGLALRETGRTLLLTNDQSVADTVRTYTSFEGVKEDYPELTEPYRAGEVYFKQSPYPKNLLIGKVDSALNVPAVAGSAIATVAMTQADIDATTALVGNTMDISTTIDGATVVTTTAILDFSGGGGIVESVAVVIADGLNTALALGSVPLSVTIIPSDTNVGFLLIPDDVTEAITDCSFPTSAIAGSVNLDVIDFVASISARSYTVKETLDNIKDVDASFTFVCEDASMIDQTIIQDIAEWCAAEKVYLQSALSADVSIISEDQAGSNFFEILASSNDNSFGTFSRDPDYQHISIAARLSSVNFSVTNSMVTPMFKQMPLIAPDAFTATEAQRMDTLRTNFYSARSGVAMFEKGTTFSPDYWIDTKYWMIWFENAVMTSVFNHMLRSKRIPQDDSGMNGIVSVINQVCEVGKRNGGIGGGKVTEAMANEIRIVTGNGSFDGTLTDGFLVYAEPMFEQSQEDRVTRTGTPIHVWLKGSGAIQDINISIVYEQ